MRYRMTTSMGEIILELDAEKAPISCENFASYAKSGHYDGTIFHRVIDNFMVQCGGFASDMSLKPIGKGIKNEWQNGLSNARHTLAMARLGNQPDSATAQFFINVGDNTFLDAAPGNDGYAVFAEVVSGMEVVEAIRKVATGRSGPHEDVPGEAVIITSAKLQS